MPTCAIATCAQTGNSIKKSPEVSFHRFPKAKAAAKIWLQKCKRKDKVSLQTAVICSLHFNPEDFIDDKVNRMLNLKEVKRLKPGTIPSRHLPLQTCGSQSRSCDSIKKLDSNRPGTINLYDPRKLGNLYKPNM